MCWIPLKAQSPFLTFYLTATIINCKLPLDALYHAIGEVDLVFERSRDFLTIADLAVYLRIPKYTLYKLVRENSAPCQKARRHWHFNK